MDAYDPDQYPDDGMQWEDKIAAMEDAATPIRPMTEEERAAHTAFWGEHDWTVGTPDDK